MRYTNEKQEIIKNIISPWFSDITYREQIVVENVNKCALHTSTPLAPQS